VQLLQLPLTDERKLADLLDLVAVEYQLHQLGQVLQTLHLRYLVTCLHTGTVYFCLANCCSEFKDWVLQSTPCQSLSGLLNAFLMPINSVKALKANLLAINHGN